MNRILKHTACLLAAVLMTGCASTGKTQSSTSQTQSEAIREAAFEGSENVRQNTEQSQTASHKPEAKELPAAQEEPVSVQEAVMIETEAENGIRPAFKEAVDAYVSFYEDYARFMSEYAKDPTNLTLLLEMTSWASRVSDMDEKLDAFEQEEESWSDQELAYFLEASARIQQLLLQSLASMPE